MENGSYSQEFINQLHNTPKTKQINRKTMLIVIAGLVSLFLGLMLILLLTKPQSSVSLNQILSLSNALEKVSKDYHTRLSDNNLRAINSSLSLSLTNFNRDASNFYLKTASKSQIENSRKHKIDLSRLLQKLDRAELNSRLDRAYAIELSYQLGIINAQQTKLLHNSKQQDLRAILSQSLNDLDNISKQLKLLNLE